MLSPNEIIGFTTFSVISEDLSAAITAIHSITSQNTSIRSFHIQFHKVVTSSPHLIHFKVILKTHNFKDDDFQSSAFVKKISQLACFSVSQYEDTNKNIIPKAKAAETYTGTIANLINSSGDILLTQSFDFQKKNNNQNIGENIAYIHSHTHLAKSAINNAIIIIRNITIKRISNRSFKPTSVKVFIQSKSFFVILSFSCIFIIQYV